MTITDPNDCAYPRTQHSQPGVYKSTMSEGLTKREYFSAMILQGYCSFPVDKKIDPDVLSLRAAVAVDQADALIIALNKAK